MREIVRIGIINWGKDNREGEREWERDGEGTAPNNHAYPQNSTHNP